VIGGVAGCLAVLAWWHARQGQGRRKFGLDPAAKLLISSGGWSAQCEIHCSCKYVLALGACPASIVAIEAIASHMEVVMLGLA
jgi:hypothetical protein